MRQVLGIAYDWVGIAEDALTDLDLSDLSAAIDPLWRWPSDHDLLPGHVVCSSLAAMLYDLPQVAYAHPDLGQKRRASLQTGGTGRTSSCGPSRAPDPQHSRSRPR